MFGGRGIALVVLDIFWRLLTLLSCCCDGPWSTWSLAHVSIGFVSCIGCGLNAHFSENVRVCRLRLKRGGVQRQHFHG